MRLTELARNAERNPGPAVNHCQRGIRIASTETGKVSSDPTSNTQLAAHELYLATMAHVYGFLSGMGEASESSELCKSPLRYTHHEGH
jgi:hypothetical protein